MDFLMGIGPALWNVHEKLLQFKFLYFLNKKRNNYSYKILLDFSAEWVFCVCLAFSFGECIPVATKKGEVQKLNAFIYYFLVFAGMLG
jgi:hypothetical protein